MATTISLRVNGNLYEYKGDADKPLLWVLREELGLQGTKYSCGIGYCGCCLVLMDGKPARSCVIRVSEAVSRDIVTIEGAKGRENDAVLTAWLEHDVSQCGYCQPSQVLAATHLLTTKPAPSDQDINRHMTVLCRCGTYQRIRDGVKAAAKKL